MYENAQKRNKINKMYFDKTYILWMFGENMCYQTQMPLIFVILFSNIYGSVADLPRKTASKIKLIYLTFGKYSLH